MVKVVKKDGSMEDFQREKIIRACEGCGASREDADRIAAEVEAEASEEIKSSEIKVKVLERLRTIDPSLERTWMEHERTKTK